MQSITTIGLDIAKSVFQVHCVDAAGQVVMRRQLKRRYVLTVRSKWRPSSADQRVCRLLHRTARARDLPARAGYVPIGSIRVVQVARFARANVRSDPKRT
jgi:hypothetical protein